jgi:hypothetical protein
MVVGQARLNGKTTPQAEPPAHPCYLISSGQAHNDDVTRVIGSLWKTIRALHLKVFGEEPKADHYSGSDVKQLAKWRDEASA